MYPKSIVFTLGFVPTLALAVSTVTVQSTVYFCPCTTSSLFGSSSSSLPVSSSSVIGTTTGVVSGTSTATSSAPTSSATGCIPLGGDCTNETVDFYCCAGSICDAGLETPTCIADDSSSSTTPSATVAPTSPATSTSAAPTSTATGCIPLGGDCTNETVDFYCCAGSICDAGLDTPTCVADDSSSSSTVTPAPTSPATSTTAAAPTSTAASGCIPLGGDCTNETIDYYCCSGATCDVGLDTPTCVAE